MFVIGIVVIIIIIIIIIMIIIISVIVVIAAMIVVVPWMGKLWYQPEPIDNDLETQTNKVLIPRSA